MARCSRVAALERLTPRTSATSFVSSPAWKRRAITSRSRAAQAAERGAQSGTLQRRLGLVVRRRGALVGWIGGQRRVALAPSQLVQRGVAGDAEQPRPLRALAGVERAVLAIRALERQRRDVLRRRPVVQQRGHVGVQVVARVAVERLEVQRRPRPGCGEREGQGAGHADTTCESVLDHTDRNVSVHEALP